MANCGGRFALCIAPWDRPISLTRVWCLYEMMTAVNYKKKITTIFDGSVMRVKSNMEFSLLQDRLEIVTRAIYSLDVYKAQATVEADRVEMARHDIHFTALLARGGRLMQLWLAELAHRLHQLR